MRPRPAMGGTGESAPEGPAAEDIVPASLRTYADLPDDELVARARHGDGAAMRVLLERYTSYARVKAKTYFLVGGDREDVVQEGRIGLYKAVREYDPEQAASFRSFAELCISNQIFNAIKGASRQKHAPLNAYVSLHGSTGEENGDRYLDEFVITARARDPVELVVAADEVAEIRAFLSDILSDFEVEVLRLYLDGRPYGEIAARLRRRSKSIDNALQRIKRKLDGFLTERERRVDEEAFKIRSPEPANGDRKSCPGGAGRLRARLEVASKAAARHLSDATTGPNSDRPAS